MRCYDEPVEVRRGMVGSEQGQVEGPEQFLWKGKLWKVYDVLAHWVETGPWWQSREPSGSVHDLMGEREVWRVEAAGGRTMSRGVFDLVFDWAQGSWMLTRCWD